MNTPAHIDLPLLVQIVYVGFNFILLSALMATALLLRGYFIARSEEFIAKTNSNTHPQKPPQTGKRATSNDNDANLDQRRFINLSWGWLMSESIGYLQAANIGLYILWNSGPEIPRMYLSDNLPNKTNELLMFLGYFLLAPVVHRWRQESGRGSTT